MTKTTHEQWLRDRRQGIGGSDIGAILGLSPYKTPLDVYLDKTGESVPEDLSDNQAVHWGITLEDTIAKEYAKREDVRVRRRNKQFIHPEHVWMRANIDRSIDGARKVLECKTAGQYMSADWGPAGTDQVPESYLVQVAWYMSILGYPHADLAVLIGGRDFRSYRFQRDFDLESMMISRAKSFWFDNVLARVPPDPINGSDIATLYAQDNGDTTVATVEVENLVERLKTQKKQMKALKSDISDSSLALKMSMRSASVLESPQGRILATWKKAKDSDVFDNQSFAVDHPDIYREYCSTKQGSRRMLIK
ncbi:MAG: hypothetical protein GY799_25300 [Desulfobulbaceae bacterium]|nr:hypothetical protein [Desulfobulbaceae bacterium]